MKSFLPVLALTLAVGCTTAYVRPYVGKQQSWPTSVGAIVNTRYRVPVFTSLPPSPYYVLAELRVDSPFYAKPEEKHLSCLTKKAAAIGADAIVLVDGKVYFSVAYGVQNTNDTKNASGSATLTAVNRFNPDFIKPDVVVIAIKWKGAPPAGLFRNSVSEVLVEEPVVVTPTPTPEPPVAHKAVEPKPEAPKPAAPAPIPPDEKPKTETPK
jgi:hypothetical protein